MRHASSPPTTRGRDKHVIAVLVAPDAVSLGIAVAQEIFGRRIPSIARVTQDWESPYTVTLVGEQSRVTLPSGAEFGGLEPLSVLETADTIIVPGLDDPLAPRSEALLTALRSAYASGVRMVSFCSGAFILGRAGILDGLRATTHWVLAKEFSQAFPDVLVQTEHVYIDDGSVHTSGGVFSANDLALHILAVDMGQAYANDYGRILVSPPNRPGGQAPYMKDGLRADSPDNEPLADPFVEWLRENIHEPLTLSTLARQQHVSERSLVRNFRREMGMSVFDWIARERVRQAKELLETSNYRISEIAAMVGFGSPETLRRNFEKIAGSSAGAYRDLFRPAPIAVLAYSG
jgi:AraC family transcriptional regulator, transcriptional activator FtrA